MKIRAIADNEEEGNGLETVYEEREGEIEIPDQIPVTFCFESKYTVGYTTDTEIKDGEVQVEANIERSPATAAIREGCVSLAPRVTGSTEEETLYPSKIDGMALVFRHAVEGLNGNIEVIDEDETGMAE